MTEPVVTVNAPPSSGWTVETYAIHNEALRSAEWKFQQERDRRYAEVNAEREKALAIKEQADRDALGLAREIQAYKDEKANELREQINSERGLYITRTEFKPIVDFVSSLSGRTSGWNDVRLLAAIVIAAAGFIYAVVK